MENPLVGIVMGSDSDLPTMEETVKILDEFNIPYEMTIISAHRTPERMYEYVSRAKKRGLEVLIAGAGGAAHLPGMLAANTVLPVIGVPMETEAFGGVDSLYSIVSSPVGVPVATMNIGRDGAKNAAILAVQILAIKYPQIYEKLSKFKEKIKKDENEKG